MTDEFDGPAFDEQPIASLSIQTFLELVVERGATDLHISADSPPLMRIDGELAAMPFPCYLA